MSRAYEASSDAGGDATEVDRQSKDHEPDIGWLIHLQCEAEWRERLNRPNPLDGADPGELADAPLGRRAGKAGETSSEDGGEVPGDMPCVPGLRYRDLTVERIDISEVGPEDSSASPDSVIAESLRESVEAAEQWTFEKTLELVADAVHPGAGRLINIALTIKEAVSDAQALASPDSPRNLHVPLLDLTGDVAVGLNVHVPGSDGSRDDAPPVSGFLSPGGGGLFGGWQIETSRDAEPAQREEAQAGQDARPGAAAHAARPSAAQTEETRRPGLPESPLIGYGLSAVAGQVEDPRRRAVALRAAASRLRARMYARPRFAAEPVLVVFDPLAGLGMWLVNPERSGTVAGPRVVIWLTPVAGVTVASIQ